MDSITTSIVDLFAVLLVNRDEEAEDVARDILVSGDGDAREALLDALLPQWAAGNLSFGDTARTVLRHALRTCDLDMVRRVIRAELHDLR